MAEITPELLRQLMPTLPKAKRDLYAPMLDASMAEFDINNERRVAAYLANLAHESAGLTRWVENLKYSAKRLTEVWPGRFPTLAAAAPYANNPEALSNKTYGGRMGNNKPGDGWKYRGRYPLQATGKGMYLKASQALDIPELYTDPDSTMDDPMIGFRVSAWIFAVEKGGNAYADRLQIKALTKAINGGYNGLAERVELFNRAMRILPDGFRLSADAKVPKDIDDVPDFIEGAETEEPEVEVDEPIVEAPVVEPTASGPKTPVVGQGVQDPSVPAVQVNTMTPAKESALKRLLAALGLGTVGVGTLFGQIGGFFKNIDSGTMKIVVTLCIGAVILYLIGQMVNGLLDRWTAYQLNKMQGESAQNRSVNTVQFVPSVSGEKK